VIDAHTHFYDPTRPGGVPWPGKGDPVLYRPVLPPEFVKLTKPFGVTGTVVVEASPLVEDNRWLLDLARDHPVIVGVVGRLLPADADFAKHLARFAKDPKFRGVRINHGEIVAALETPAHLDRLRALSDAGLALDVNGGPDVLGATARLAEKLPALTVVVNHVGNPHVDGKPVAAGWRDGVAAAAKAPNVWCKLSGLVDGTRLRGRKAPADPAFYRPVFDAVWAAFGPDRLLFGSNWPVSDHTADYAGLLGLAAGLVKPHGAAAERAVFGGNAAKAYRLAPRP
jgi:predicted TIM-barrel fold metal-dependent hydrolase